MKNTNKDIFCQCKGTKEMEMSDEGQFYCTKCEKIVDYDLEPDDDLSEDEKN